MVIKTISPVLLLETVYITEKEISVLYKNCNYHIKYKRTL